MYSEHSPQKLRPLGRPRKEVKHDYLRRGILTATFERPRTLSKLYEDLAVYSDRGRFGTKVLLKDLIAEGLIVMQGDFYLNAQMPTGHPMFIA